MLNRSYFFFNGSDFGNNTSAFEDTDFRYNDSYYSLNSTDFDFRFIPSLTLQKLQQAVVLKVLIAFTALGFIANAFQLGCICRKGKKRTTFDLVVLSLSISDLLISMIGLSQFCFMLFPDKWLAFALGKSFKIVSIPSYFSVFASFFHAIFIAMQRICAVAFPLKVRRLLSRRRCFIAVLFIWTISIGMSLAFVFSIPKATATVSGYIFISSVGPLILLYSALLVILIKTKPAIQTQRRAQSNKRVMIYSFALMFVFVCCVLPFGINMLNVFKNSEPKAWFFQISFALYLCNPFFDSVLYFFIIYCRPKKSSEARIRVQPYVITSHMDSSGLSPSDVRSTRCQTETQL